jgi:hypothetical protein
VRTRLLVAGLLVATHASAESPDPKPYVAPPERDRRLEMLDLGPVVGVSSRPSTRETIRYQAGFTYGAQARVEVLRWLGVRALFTSSHHAVHVDPGALLPGAEADQPGLSVLQFGARVEPTWPVTPRLRLWFGVGAAWDRIWADKPALTGLPVQAANRTGTASEWSAALGGTYDAIPRWLTVSLGVSAAVVTAHSGTMFGRLQAVDESITRPRNPLVLIASLPEFDRSYSALLSAGLLL